jgi:hypothetical protein
MEKTPLDPERLDREPRPSDAPQNERSVNIPRTSEEGRRDLSANEIATRTAADEGAEIVDGEVVDEDSRSNADHVTEAVGEAAGGISGVLAGAALGSLAGPIGTIIGGLAGALSGWWAGHTIVDAARRYDLTHDPYFRERYTGTATYDDVRPAFQLGYLAGANPEWSAHTFEDVEPTLREGWHNVRARPGDWVAVRDYARDAFDRARASEPR